MAIDMASVYAARYRKQPDMLRAAVMGQSPDPKLDSYTALNALRLVKEADMMDMAGQAQQPTSAPSILAENLAPPPMQQGLGAMVPGAMGAPVGQMPQGMPPQQRAPMPQPVMQAASGGLAGMYTPEEDYADGGIVAFSGEDGSYVRDETAPEYVYNEDGPSQMRVLESEVTGDDDADEDVGSGSNSALDRFNAMLMRQGKEIVRGRGRTLSPEDAIKMEKAYYAREMERAGPDIYKDEIARGAQDDADRIKARRVGEANALFTAAGKVLTGNRLSSGAREALPAYGSAMNEVERLDQAAKSANSRAQFALKDAQRKERTGASRAANASMENYRKFLQEENKAVLNRNIAVANIAKSGAMANRPLRAGSGAQPSGFNVLFNAKQALSADPKNPQLQAAVKNAEQAVAATKQSVSFSDVLAEGPKAGALTSKANIDQAKLNADIQEKAAAEVDKTLFRNQAYRDAQAAERMAKANNTPYTGVSSKQVRDDLIAETAKRNGAKSGAAAPAQQTALPMPSSKADLKPNQLYNTNRGLAVWNGTSFTPQ